MDTSEQDRDVVERRMQFGLKRALKMPAKPNEPAKAKKVQRQSK